MRFCAVTAGVPCALRVGWKSEFADLFLFALGGPTAPTGVKRQKFGSPGPGNGKADEVGLELGLGLN